MNIDDKFGKDREKRTKQIENSIILRYILDESIAKTKQKIYELNQMFIQNNYLFPTTICVARIIGI
jgi:hypothetical protein